MAPKRWARIFICSALSSPETYNTLPPIAASCCETCSKRVDLPIPGSPPIKINDPGTTPPPKTRFSSASLVCTRGSFFGMTSAIFVGCIRCPVRVVRTRRSVVS